jgi:Uncharacterized conserved protein
MISLLYCVIINIYSGFGTTFSWFWVVAGLIGLAASTLVKFLVTHDIKVQRSFQLLTMIVILTGLAIFAYVEGIIIANANRKAGKGLDYILVLGAQVRGTQVSRILLKRLETAVSYLKENQRTIAIVSGGRGERESLSEAEAMKLYMLKKGIASNRIVKEDKSKNTFENILYSKALIKSNTKAAIVTNGFHVYRSTHIARKQGLGQIQGLAAPTDKLLAVNYYVREAVGVIKDKLLGNL